jgi:DNA-binding response OmpR family regulator
MSEVLRVLVVEDDPDLQQFLHLALSAEGFAVTAVAEGRLGLAAADPASIDIVLLDLDLPDTDGLDVLSAIRRRGDLPVIVLTGRRLENQRVAGLELGADDYIVKPFSPRELVARIRTVLRRAAGGAEPAASARELTIGDLRIDLRARRVEVAEQPIELTKREFDLLAFLAGHQGRVFSREELLNEVWGSSEEWQVLATVTEHVRRVRLKIETDPSQPRYIHNVRGVGYRFG